MRNKYQWQGEPVKVRFGKVKQKENTEKPLYWYNFECNNELNLNNFYEQKRDVFNDGFLYADIPAIEITQGDQTFIIANHFGIGVHKLLKGGWPNHTHFSLNGVFEERDEPYYKFTSFRLAEYEYHESTRREWQKSNYPEEFERMERLRDSFRNVSLVKN